MRPFSLLSRARDILWLCAENADCGQRNGERLGAHATSSGPRSPGTNHCKKTRRQLGGKPVESTGPRTITHVAVLLCLMNGARRKVVGARRSVNPPPPHPTPPPSRNPRLRRSRASWIHRGRYLPGSGSREMGPCPAHRSIGRKNPNLARTGMPILLRRGILIA